MTYADAIATNDASIKVFHAAQAAFRAREIDAATYCEAFAVHKEAMKIFDAAYAVEAGWEL